MKGRSRAGGIVPDVALDPSSSTPLYEQLYASIRGAIRSGTLRRGAQLASSRALSDELGVSRFTTLAAIGLLRSEGYAVARVGSGTFVADELPESTMNAATAASREPNGQSPGRKQPLPSRRGRTLATVEITGPRGVADEPRAFRPRRPPLDVFPLATWKRIVHRQWSRPRHEILDYGEPAGLRPLREAIARHVGATRGVRCTADHVVITSGAQQAAALLFRILLDPGDAVWTEEPGILDVRGALVEAGARLVPVPVDASGIDVGAGRRRAPRARLAYISPSHQYPTGATLTRARREDLLRWAERADAWIVEDDYDSYFRYEGHPLPALQRLDADRNGEASRVVYIGTFSKTMYPSLRLGYCIAPSRLVPLIANARAVADRNSPLVEQAALAEFIDAGLYDRHLRRVRTVCAERHEAMHASLVTHLGKAVTVQRMHAGTHVVVTLGPELVRRLRAHSSGKFSAASAVAAGASADGLVVFPMDRYCLGPPRSQQLVLGYGGLSVSRIRAGVERLARVIDRARSIGPVRVSSRP